MIAHARSFRSADQAPAVCIRRAAFGLGLTSLPAAGWAAPISLASGARVKRFATTAPSWPQSTSGDVGVMLVDLFASVADRLSFYQDAAATDAYLGTACDPPC